MWLLFLFLSFSGNAQDLPEAQRLERCQNNKNRLAELETQLKVVSAELSQIWSKKEIEDKRDKMVFVKKLLSFNKGYPEEEEKKKLDRIGVQYGFKSKDCHEGTYWYFSCLAELVELIAGKIDKAVPLQNKRPVLVNKKNEIEKQMASHRTNIIALGCNGEASNNSSTGGSLRLVGPKVVDSRNSKGTWHEYVVSATSAIIKQWGDPPDKKTITWNFNGMPGSLSPTEEFTITITGTLDINPGGDLPTPASAVLRFTRLDVVSEQHAYISAKNKRDGKYVFRVKDKAESVTIEIAAEPISVFAIYRYEKKILR